MLINHALSYYLWFYCNVAIYTWLIIAICWISKFESEISKLFKLHNSAYVSNNNNSKQLLLRTINQISR